LFFCFVLRRTINLPESALALSVPTYLFFFLPVIFSPPGDKHAITAIYNNKVLISRTTHADGQTRVASAFVQTLCCINDTCNNNNNNRTAAENSRSGLFFSRTLLYFIMHTSRNDWYIPLFVYRRGRFTRFSPRTPI